MDFLNEEEGLLAQSPLDVIEHVLAAENLPFDRTDDEGLAFALPGDWKEYELWFSWRQEAACLQLCLALDLKVETRTFGPLYELLALVNQQAPIGHFELWPEDGEVMFRYALPLPEGERPTTAQAAAMIDAAMEAGDRFYPAFSFLLERGKSPKDAMAACLFETVGRA
jgi:hypothetical protein